MEIKGFMKTSMLDYPGKIASVIFLPKCNFHCPYCHNKELVLDDPRLMPFEEEKVFEYLNEKKKWIDGVVISGGEPTLHVGIINICKRLKEMGFKVKLDTNGTNPKMLKELIDKKFVDYVAMDIKSSKDKYEKATSVKVNIEAVDESIQLLKKDLVEYEFRTTVLPGLVDEEDMPKIGEWLKGAKQYYIQQFVPIKTLNESYMTKEPHTHDSLHKMKDSVSPYVEFCAIRGAS